MQRKENPVSRFLFLYLPLILILLFLLFPFYWTFVTSIKPERELYGEVVTYWPREATFRAYRALFLDYNFLRPMTNSLIVALSTTVLTLFVATLAAYSFSRFRFRGARRL